MAEKVLKCPACEKKFETITKLEEHIADKHPNKK